MNIILIGMPSSGKSTAGVVLAKTLGYGFIDSDLLIQSREHALLCDIIAQKGAEEFLRIEEEVNAQLWAERCVIATGGSVIYGEAAMRHLKELGKIVYLDISEREVERRLGNIVLRGVVMRKKGESIAELYAERTPLYERYADLTVHCDGLTIEQTVETIVAALAERE